ncbi:MAG: flippase [Pyrinomonadaceae bacterium]
MTPNAATGIPSTAGLTTKVVIGSLWTLAGQIVPLGLSFVATYFVIRLLDDDGYGALIFIGLVPTYLAFADLGMSVASTKFAAEAFGRGDHKKEADTVRTCMGIALVSAIPIAAIVFLFSDAIIRLGKVPEYLVSDAGAALRIVSVSFVIGLLNGIINTPELTRLRMDLNTFVNAGSRIFTIVATPVVLYLGYGLVGAAVVILLGSIVNFCGHLVISGRLLKNIFELSIDRSLILPLSRFGGALLVSFVATSIVSHSEKLILPALVSSRGLGYYSVAFTLASLATFFSAAMVQSLIPAFSQLFSTEKKTELVELFRRSIKLNLMVLLPVIAILAIFARPFFFMWGGEGFGRESTSPFYILLAGLLFNIAAYTPYALLLAAGRSGLLAKLYWIEAIVYIPLAFFLISRFSIIGAALAWSIRVVCDAMILGIFAGNLVNARLEWMFLSRLLLGAAIFAPPLVLATAFENYTAWLVLSATLSLATYCYVTWTRSVTTDEKTWILNRFRAMVA